MFVMDPCNTSLYVKCLLQASLFYLTFLSFIHPSIHSFIHVFYGEPTIGILTNQWLSHSALNKQVAASGDKEKETTTMIN